MTSHLVTRGGGVRTTHNENLDMTTFTLLLPLHLGSNLFRKTFTIYHNLMDT